MKYSFTGVISRNFVIVLVCILIFSGFAAAESFSITDRSNWNQGSYDGTSADRDSHSGTLGLGYQDNVLGDSSLQAYWRLDDSASRYGGTVRDYSGNGNHGTTEGAESGYNGVFRTDSFYFTYGNSECTDDCFIRVDDDSSLDFTSSYSIAAWVYLDQSGSLQDDHFIMGHGDYFNPPTIAIGISDDAGYEGYPHLEYNSPGSDYDSDENDLYGDRAIPTNEWVHLAYVRDGSEVTFYINGDEAGTDTLTISGDRDPGGSLKIGDQYEDGDDGTYTEGWDGRIDELQIYDKTLSPFEVEELYLNGEPYTGTYITETVDTTETQQWNSLEVNVESTGVSATFRALDSNGNEVDSQDLGVLDPGRNNYSLSVQDSENAEVVFSGTSYSPTSTWEITDAIIHYGEGSDGDGPDPGGTGDYHTEETCPTNTIYGPEAVRWIPEEEVSEHPEAFEPDVQEALNSKEAGFCAGDDESEFVVHQRCQSGFCSTDTSVRGVAYSEKSCVLDGSRLPVDDNQRKIYSPGTSVTLQYENEETISCFDGTWFMEWPISFDQSEATVQLGESINLPITVLNVEDTAQEFEIRISESKSEEIQQFSWFNTDVEDQNRRRDTISLTVPPKETETVSLRVYGGKNYNTARKINIEGSSLDSNLYGEDEVTINVEKEVGGSSRNEVPGLSTAQLVALTLIGVLTYWRHI